jgi:hypothetical protein
MPNTATCARALQQREVDLEADEEEQQADAQLRAHPAQDAVRIEQADAVRPERPAEEDETEYRREAQPLAQPRHDQEQHDPRQELVERLELLERRDGGSDGSVHGEVARCGADHSRTVFARVRGWPAGRSRGRAAAARAREPQGSAWWTPAP